MLKSDQKTEIRTLMQRLVREGTLIVYFLLALFLLIALFSYSPNDPGFTTTGSGDLINNSVGVYGAWIADILLHLLGYLAYSVPAWLSYKVYTSFRESQLECFQIHWRFSIDSVFPKCPFEPFVPFVVQRY